MSYPQPQQFVVVHVVPSNGLGVAGFVVSLISLFCCGLTSPVGLFLSLVALARPPRGFAFAGVILGGLGSAWLLIGGLAMLLRITDSAKAPPIEPPAPPAVSAPTDDGMIQLDPPPLKRTGSDDTK